MDRIEVEAARRKVQGLLDSACRESWGERPARCYLEPQVVSALVELALSLPEATREPPAGPWFVLEGKHWLRDRRLNERFLPLVYSGGVALVMESVHDARLVAALLNWCGVAAPPHPVTYY